MKKKKSKKKLDAKIRDFLADNLHKRNPGALKYLRERVKCSVEIYKEFVK